MAKKKKQTIGYKYFAFAHFVLISANLSNYAKMMQDEGLFEMICEK